MANRGGHSHYRRVNKSIHKTFHKKVKPFLKTGTMRPCEGRKIGAFSQQYLAADFSKGLQLLRNGNFSHDEENRGFPDAWAIKINGPHPGYTYLKDAASATTNSIVVDSATVGNITSPYKSVNSIPIMFEPVLVYGNTDDDKQYPYIPHNSGDSQSNKNKGKGGAKGIGTSKIKEIGWIANDWNGSATDVPLMQPLVYYHVAGGRIQKQLVVLDDRPGTLNTESGLSPYSGNSSLYIDVADANSVTELTSSSFPVKPGEIYYIAFAATKAYTSRHQGDGFPPAPGANCGLVAQIVWAVRENGNPNGKILQHKIQNLIPPFYQPSDVNWEIFETTVQCPLSEIDIDPNDYTSHSKYDATAYHAFLIFKNARNNNVPIWLSDAKVVDTYHHKWHYSFYNPGASQFDLNAHFGHNPCFLHKMADTYVVPVCPFPEETGNVNLQVYVENNPRDVATKVNIDAYAIVSDPHASVGITYSVSTPGTVEVQPLEYWSVRIDGSEVVNTGHYESACTVALIHSKFNGSEWIHTLIGRTNPSSNLSTYEKNYHSIRLVHDPSIITSKTGYGGSYGAIIGYAFGASFAAASSTFACGVPGVMGGSCVGVTANTAKYQGILAAGLIRDFTVSSDYPGNSSTNPSDISSYNFVSIGSGQNLYWSDYYHSFQYLYPRYDDATYKICFGYYDHTHSVGSSATIPFDPSNLGLFNGQTWWRSPSNTSYEFQTIDGNMTFMMYDKWWDNNNGLSVQWDWVLNGLSGGENVTISFQVFQENAPGVG